MSTTCRQYKKITQGKLDIARSKPTASVFPLHTEKWD